MNARYTVLAAAVAGFALGAVTLDQLHAQAKPPVYIVAEIDMKNPAARMRPPRSLMSARAFGA